MLLGGICTLIVLAFIEVHESQICLRINLAVMSEKKIGKREKLRLNETGSTTMNLAHLHDRKQK